MNGWGLLAEDFGVSGYVVMNYFCVYCFHIVFYLCVRGGLGGEGYV